ncbi:MAG TPA: NADH:flavin oxidoreductase [Lacipirellulaceae bacterium]|nr:NADH:flavin oxidoreductase [Lacipirellulaceae bacterium]
MSEKTNYPKVAQLKDLTAFRARLAELGLSLPIDDRILSAAEGSPLAQPMQVGSITVANRWCIHPMEGWDANRDGSPTAHTLRRWQNFGRSGAKLIWGGEAAAIRPDGRANPNQTRAIDSNRAGLASLLHELQQVHRQSFGTLDGLLVGLQLTHSGRFCKPDDHHHSAPRIAYHHPLLDAKFKIDPLDDSIVWTDTELEVLIDDYVNSARLAYEVGFKFVDVKACHGYLLHEFLSARRRPGRFGGDLAGRSRVLTTIIDRIHNEIPGLGVGVRLSVFDSVPYATSREVGRPMDYGNLLPYEFGFGVDADNPLKFDLTEPLELIRILAAQGVIAINLSCGSPYYNPHLQRPAIFPPFDGYQPPEDPLVGVWRQIDVVRQCKAALPNIPIVGTGYSYLQDYLPNVAQAAVRAGWTDFVGLGRVVLSYPELPADTLAGRPLARKQICRTFSDCTTAPRNGLISGCYPLDPYYKSLPQRNELLAIKQRWQH